MAKTIGIDLGTTNSVSAIKKIETEILTNKEGDLLTPSVVSLRRSSDNSMENQLLTGKAALNWMLQEPENTIVSIKRLMGRGYGDPEIQKLIHDKHFSYAIKPISHASSNSLCVLLNDQEYTPEQISSQILQKIKQDSEEKLGESIDFAVVTVPAYFNDKQKQATRRAAMLANLKVQRLLPEPTAAAISFGVDQMQPGEAKTVLIYDLGGGTFDISVLTIADGQFIEQGKGGDMWLGGDDIDNLILQYVYQETEREYKLDDLQKVIEKTDNRDKNRFLGELKNKVEQAKIKLSSEQKAYIDVLGILKDEDGDLIDIDVELSRTQFNEMLKPFVERTIQLSEKVIADIGFDRELIDQVILVGGSSNIPMIIDAVRDLFGEDKVMLHPRPMLAIAEGAAILAHRLSDSYECPQCGSVVSQSDEKCSSCGLNLVDNMSANGLIDIVHSSSHDYFISLTDGSRFMLVEQNTPLPIQVNYSFKLLHWDQKLAHLRFSNEVNDQEELIGELWLSFDLDDLDQETASLPEINLDFEIDINNLITVSASLNGLVDTHISKTLSRGGVDEQLFIDLASKIELVNDDDADYYVKHEFLHRSTKIADSINRIVDADTGEVNQDNYQTAVDKQRIAQEIYENHESFQGNLNFVHDFSQSFGYLLPQQQSQQLDEKIRAFENAMDNSEMTQIIKLRDEVLSETDRYPVITSLHTIQMASEYAFNTNPDKGDYFIKAMDDLIKLIQQEKTEQVEKLLLKVLPEAHELLNRQSQRELHIYKDISA